MTIGNSVTRIGSSAFSGCIGLTSVTIGNSVTSIGGGAFGGCTGLTSVTIPDSVTSIGGTAFYGCTGLTSITIPNSVTSIGDYAFDNTAWYNNQPDGLVYAGKVAYKYKGSMSSNTSIVLEEGTLGIADQAFLDCKELTSVTIGNSVTSIGRGAFYNCTGLTSIIVVEGNSRYHSEGNCLIETATKTLILGCKTSVIPTDGSVTSIGRGAFYGCRGLTGATIPDSVTSIGDYAFYGCKELTSITIPDSVTNIGDSAFSGCDKLQDIYITDIAAWCNISGLDNLMRYGSSNKKLYINNELVTSITIPNGVTAIPSYAFSDCSGLTSVTIPDSVTSIGYEAFYYSGLTSVTIGNSVTSIGDRAFFYCTELTSITFNGTIKQWNAIRKGEFWGYNTGNYVVHCTDGDISKANS